MNPSHWPLAKEPNAMQSVSIHGVLLNIGDRIRLRPRTAQDICGIALDGKTAIIEAIEQDCEAKLHLAVLLDDDPGRDLGALRQPGYRFFFPPEEVEPLPDHDEREKQT